MNRKGIRAFRMAELREVLSGRMISYLQEFIQQTGRSIASPVRLNLVTNDIHFFEKW
jgi:hypothetical protein